MQKIVGSRLYDTATAEEIDKWENGYSRNDFRWSAETLYMTGKGAYFLHGKGGPRSTYRTPSGGDAWTGGEDIRPLKAKEAMAWLEEHSPINVITKLFPGQIVEA